MKLIILAAGEGKRLRPYTNDKPKCMVKYQDKEIISHILEITKPYVSDIAIVGGYKFEVLKEFLKDENIKFYQNNKFDTTNMLYTLFCAKEFLDDDVIVSYADIIYKSEIFKKLVEAENDFSVIVDKKWKELWLQRMPNPLEDAETLKIQNGKIKEIGKKPKSYDEVEAQYIGLIKIKKSFLQTMVKFYESLDKNANFDNQNFENMYFTSFIQGLIDKFDCISPVYIKGGWVEIDSVLDLKTKAIICDTFSHTN